MASGLFCAGLDARKRPGSALVALCVQEKKAIYVELSPLRCPLCVLVCFGGVSMIECYPTNPQSFDEQKQKSAIGRLSNFIS